LVLVFYNFATQFIRHFWGGFAVDADFGDGFSGCIEGPKIDKKRKKSINFHFSPGGGSGPKHSAFCGGRFSINPITRYSGPKKTKSDQKNPEPSTFSNGAKNVKK
jgi:hypothetical protein